MTAVYNYSAYCSHNRQRATVKLAAVSNAILLKMLFYAWLEDFKEVRKARHWIKAEGTRERNDSEEVWFWPEGKDPISILPGDVQIKVFSHVALQGLCPCAQVCRSSKEIIKEPRLWNKIDFHPICHL